MRKANKNKTKGLFENTASRTEATSLNSQSGQG